MKNNKNTDEPKVGWSEYQEITDDTDFEFSTAVIAGKPSRAPWRRSFAQKLACGT